MTSQEIQEQLGVQTEHIKEKKKVVLDDLSKVEPAVNDAQNGMTAAFMCVYDDCDMYVCILVPAIERVAVCDKYQRHM